MFCAATLLGCSDGHYGGPLGRVILSSSDSIAFFSARSGTCPASDWSSIGPCTVSRTSNCTDDGDSRSAGSIELNDANTDVHIDPDSQDLYDGTGVGWPPGANVMISAKGADVPAFQGIITLPSPIAAIDGFVSGSVIDRSQDLTIGWPQQTGMSLFVGLTVGSVSIDCGFDAGDGGGTIPSAALSTLSAGTATAHADVGMVSMTTVENWSLHFQAVGYVPPEGESLELR
jgi:hypothetical protein